MYNAHGHKSRFPICKQAQFVTALGINHVIKPDFEFYWQDEYGVLSFGEKNIAAVVRYIHNQKKHHADGTLIHAMEMMEEA